MMPALLLGATDWLGGGSFPARIERTGQDLILTNGLVERRIRLEPFVSTYSLKRLDSNHEFLRSTEPEGRLMVDGKEILIGGTTTAPNKAFLLETWLKDLKPAPQSLPLKSIKEVEVQAPIPYKPKPGQSWPPKGKAVLLSFGTSEILAEVRLEIYDDLPVIGKQIRVQNTSAKTVRLQKLTSERLSMVEGESLVETPKKWKLPPVSVFASMAFNGMSIEGASPCVHWEEDSAYTTQVNYELKTPCVLDVRPPLGPDIDLKQGEDVLSPRSYLVLHDTEERERRSLGIRKTFRKLAPWVEDNPLMLHIRVSDDAAVKAALDQAAECGFEMAIMSFGSGLDMEDTSPANIAKYKALREYADSKGIRFGGYSLLASRRIDDENDVINPKTGKIGGATFGNSPCLGSKWGIGYFERIKTFMDKTGFKVLEHDGSYPGDPCASTTHPGHRGYEDSIWRQYQMIEDLYRWCREKDIFLNVPDTYYLAGSNKNGMGYRETNWSLPRAQQHIHARQNMYDGTFEKAPSMGWMFVPLTEYHGGGAEATIEPLKDHLADYEMHFANTLGYGAQACWRGTRLYDSPETKAMVQRMVKWFKDHRAILESDVVHLRRANGRQLDYILHVNPLTKHQGMLVVYNPTPQEMSEEIKIPLAGSGLAGTVSVAVGGGGKKRVKSQGGQVTVKVSVKGNSWSYVTLNAK